MDKPVIFYDGNCGLCHSLVSFVIKRDKTGIFNFSPQQGKALKNFVDQRQSVLLPDSVYLIDTDYKIYLKAFSLIFILKKLGGIWRVLGILYSLLPMRLANIMYDFVAKTRYTFFSRKVELCPLMPPELKARFLA